MTFLRSALVLAVLLISPAIGAQTAGNDSVPAVDATTSVAPSPHVKVAATVPGSNSLGENTWSAETSPEPTRSSKERWYGWQTLALDALALTALVATPSQYVADKSAGTRLFYASLGTFVLGGPTVHAAHGNWGKAAGSAASRLGAILLMGLAVEASKCPYEHCDASEQIVAGGLVGFALIPAVIAVDSAVLARETVEVNPMLVPTASLRKDGGWVGMTGRF
jgi:hypothetical protein